MAEDVKEWLQENANKVGQDLLRQIDDGIGFVVIFVHKDSKTVRFTSNIVKRPLIYILERVLKAVDKTSESRIITLNVPEGKLIKN
jgi:ribosomal protein L24E